MILQIVTHRSRCQPSSVDETKLTVPLEDIAMKSTLVARDRLCVLCRERDAKFTFRGRVKRDKDHNLCHRCYRSLWDRNVAHGIALTRPRLFDLAASVFFRQLLEQPLHRQTKFA